jgi:F0F1-type ATP synthase membrane subunit b/b'
VSIHVPWTFLLPEKDLARVGEMAETVDSEISEIERIINGYKQGISRAIEEEKDRFEELSHVLAKSQHEAERLIAEARQQAHRISEDTIAQAEQKAQQIVNEAEEIVKNEAKKKSRQG